MGLELHDEEAGRLYSSLFLLHSILELSPFKVLFGLFFHRWFLVQAFSYP